MRKRDEEREHEPNGVFTDAGASESKATLSSAFLRCGCRIHVALKIDSDVQTDAAFERFTVDGVAFLHEGNDETILAARHAPMHIASNII
jgi:hypothetical protein